MSLSKWPCHLEVMGRWSSAERDRHGYLQDSPSSLCKSSTRQVQHVRACPWDLLGHAHVVLVPYSGMNSLQGKEVVSPHLFSHCQALKVVVGCVSPEKGVSLFPFDPEGLLFAHS